MKVILQRVVSFGLFLTILASTPVMGNVVEQPDIKVVILQELPFEW